MAVALNSPLTGGPQTGFTTPAYVLTADNAPSLYGEQHYVSGITGTQAGVTTHSIGSPFTIAFFRPQTLSQLPAANPVTGIVANVPRNVYKAVTRKGCMVAANQAVQNVIVRTEISVPAGADTYSPAEIRAAIAAHVGALWQQSAGIGDMTVTGTI